MNSPDENRNEPRHPIQVVARRSGLSADVLRVWEKRYGAVSPKRGRGGRRLYSNADVERVVLLRRATLGGRRIGEVAGMSDDDLRALVQADEAAVAPGSRATSGPEAADSHLEECLRAARALDGPRLEAALDRASASLGSAVLLDGVLVPFMRSVGEDWSRGTIGVAHEHLASAVARSLLGRLRANLRSADHAPCVVVTTPAGQRHELGALMTAVAASGQGWNAVYLGPDLPAGEIAAAARNRKARAVALSIVHPSDDDGLNDELRRIRAELEGHPVGILVGGGAAGHYEAVLEEIGARRLHGFAELGDELRSLA